MTTGGLATAVALAGGVGDMGLDDGTGEQAGLFEADAPLPIAPVAAVGKSGPKGGRPLNRRNRSTEEARQFFLSRYRSPLMGLGEIYSRSAEDLARELQLTTRVEDLAPGQQALKTYTNAEGEVTGYLVWDRAKAFDKQTAAMQAALPYVERKQPIAIDTDAAIAGIILIGDHAGVSDEGDGVLTLDLTADEAPGAPDAETQENQHVSEPQSVRPPEPQSHDQAKPRKQWGEFEE